MIKRVVSTLCVSCLLATRFLYVAAAEEEEDPPTEYIRVDIPESSYSAYQYWFNCGFSRFSVPLDDEGNPLFNESGVSVTETININSTQSNSTYTETDSYNLSGSINENIKGSLYAQASTGSGGTTNYNITTGAGAAVGNLPVTGTETITGSGSTSGTIVNGNITSAGNASITGTSNSQITYLYHMPWLTGSYKKPSGFDPNSYISITTVQYFVVYTDGTSSLNPTIYYRSNRGGLVTYTLTQNYTAGIRRMVYKFVAQRIDNGWIDFTLAFENAPNKVIPVYIGNGTDLTDDQKTAYSIDTQVETTLNTNFSNQNYLIDSGTTQSQNVGSNVSSTNNTASSKVSDLGNLEDTFNSNLNSSLNNISLPNVSSIAKFGSSARWVAQQFTYLTSFQEINFPLVFCLSLGLALTLLGRIRT